MGITVARCRDCNEYKYIEAGGYCRDCVPFKRLLDSIACIDVSNTIDVSPVELLEKNAFSVEQLSYLWVAAESGSSILFSTQSHIANLINAVSVFIPCSKKIHSISKAYNISSPSVNCTKILGSNRSKSNMLRNSLRGRPEYILIDKIQSDAAPTAFQAISTGHSILSSTTGDSFSSAVNKLNTKPENVPKNMIDALDILCIQDGLSNERIYEPEMMRNGSLKSRRAYINTSSSSHTQLSDKICCDSSWDYGSLLDELRRREKVLQYLIDERINSRECVSRVIQFYMQDKDAVLSKINN